MSCVLCLTELVKQVVIARFTALLNAPGELAPEMNEFSDVTLKSEVSDLT